MNTAVALPSSSCFARSTQPGRYEFVPSTFKGKSGALFLDLVPVRPLPTRSRLPPMHEKTEELGTR